MQEHSVETLVFAVRILFLISLCKFDCVYSHEARCVCILKP